MKPEHAAVPQDPGCRLQPPIAEIQCLTGHTLDHPTVRFHVAGGSTHAQHISTQATVWCTLSSESQSCDTVLYLTPDPRVQRTRAGRKSGGCAVLTAVDGACDDRA